MLGQTIKKLRKERNNKNYICPNCEKIITLQKKPKKNMVITCPNCNRPNILKISQQKSEKKYEKLQTVKRWLSEFNLNATILGLIITLTSVIILLIKNPLTFKISITLLIIATLIPLLIMEKNQNISLKLTISIILYIIFLYFLTEADLELFLILIFLGVLIIKAILDDYIPQLVKMRMNVFLFAFFIIFIILIIKRIMNLVGY